ncbi:MAG: carboxylesterase [Gammaproteobacteria bacterium]|nr:carboxylesterase [Gammaproteobacteria bacterium]
MSLKYIKIEPEHKANACIIWLHGLGANGHDFEGIVPELNLPPTHGIRFIFPHAPNMPVTINNGYIMPAWYDILENQLEKKVDEEGIKLSSLAIKEIIDEQISHGIASERILLIGFSQGGAVVYETGLSYSKPLAGIFALSTYFATADTINIHPSNQDIKINLYHGEYDPVVPIQLANQALNDLEKQQIQAELLSYRMEHNVCLEEIEDIARIIKQKLTDI